MTQYVFTKDGDAVTVILDGTPYAVDNSNANYPDLVSAIKSQNWDVVRAICTDPANFTPLAGSPGLVVIYAGNVTFTNVPVIKVDVDDAPTPVAPVRSRYDRLTDIEQTLSLEHEYVGNQDYSIRRVRAALDDLDIDFTGKIKLAEVDGLIDQIEAEIAVRGLNPTPVVETPTPVVDTPAAEVAVSDTPRHDRLSAIETKLGMTGGYVGRQGKSVRRMRAIISHMGLNHPERLNISSVDAILDDVEAKLAADAAPAAEGTTRHARLTNIETVLGLSHEYVGEAGWSVRRVRAAINNLGISHRRIRAADIDGLIDQVEAKLAA